MLQNARGVSARVLAITKHGLLRVFGGTPTARASLSRAEVTALRDRVLQMTSDLRADGCLGPPKTGLASRLHQIAEGILEGRIRVASPAGTATDFGPTSLLVHRVDKLVDQQSVSLKGAAEILFLANDPSLNYATLSIITPANPRTRETHLQVGAGAIQNSLYIPSAAYDDSIRFSRWRRRKAS